MSPVGRSRSRSSRSLLLAVSGLVLGLVLVLVLFIVAIPSLTESGKVEVRLGPERFDVGPAVDRATEIADRGPILLPDVAGKDRDVFVQHVGDDPLRGWFVFDARRSGVGRDCTLEWQPDDAEFADPCLGTPVGAQGEGLTQYTVEVTDQGQVVVDFREA
jgi:hypothetical protein